MRQRIIGPRGGAGTAEVSCYTCLCGSSCRLLATTKEFGCGDWVDEHGNRVDMRDSADLPGSEAGLKDCAGCVKCADVVDPPPLPAYHDDDMASIRPLQAELNRLQSARLENMRGIDLSISHAADLDPDVAEATMERDDE